MDYGYTREEQLAGRHRGTLKAIRQHSISASPYEAPGEQDITAHVNFTALAAAAEKHGMQIHKLVTQSQFLLGVGEPTSSPTPSKKAACLKSAPRSRCNSSIWSRQQAWERAFTYRSVIRESRRQQSSLYLA